MIDELSALGLLDDADRDRFVRRGHFVYESGDHGDTWLVPDLLFANPRRLQRSAAQIAERLWSCRPDLVCGPLVGGALVGQWVAHELNVTFVYADPQPASGTVGRSYAIPQSLRPALRGKRTVVVDDVINAGWASLACVREIEEGGGRVTAVASLIMRTPGTVKMWKDQGIAVEYLAGVEWQTWSARDCPLCRSGMPVEPLT
jgi:orotate phosphoribosyltransferase